MFQVTCPFFGDLLLGFFNNDITNFILQYLQMSKSDSSKGQITLDKTLKWLDKTEGRDKFCKMIQYACRYLKYRQGQKGNKEMEKKLDALFCNMRDARKLFRLFKSLKEYGKLLELIAKKDTMAFQDFILNALTRIFFLLYWLFDNLNILSKLGLLKMDAKQLAKKGSTCWFIALLATFVLTIKNIVLNTAKISYLQKGTISAGNGETNEKISQIIALKKINSKQFLTLIKTIGDMLPAGQGAQFYEKVFGFNVNEGWCGLGGFISAFLTSYDLYG